VLHEGYQELCRLRGTLFDFDAYTPPTPERFILKFRLRSVMGVRGRAPVYSSPNQVHTVEFVAPSSYPEVVTPSDIRFTSAPIFHPNVYTDGRICIGDYVSSESLGRFVLRIARMIKFEPAFINEHSAANGSAVPWYSANLRSFPVDRAVLPTLDRFLAGQVKKAFVPGPIVR
jgi:hypothetical protein